MELDDGILSLVTVGYAMNTTTFNQGNHCTVAFNVLRPAIDVGNQALAGSEGLCKILSANLQDELQALAKTIFSQDTLSGLGVLRG